MSIEVEYLFVPQAKDLVPRDYIKLSSFLILNRGQSKKSSTLTSITFSNSVFP